MQDGAADLDQLLARRRQLFHAPLRAQRELVVGDQPAGGLDHAPALHPAERQPVFATQKKVLRHRQMRREQRFLVDHRNPDRRRLRRGFEMHLAALPQHLPGIALDDSGDDLHQRGLARAIFAQQQMHFAGLNGEVAVAEGRDAAVSFLDVIEFEEHRKRNQFTPSGLP